MKIDIAHAGRPKLGELSSGDLAFQREGGDTTLFGVIDALGHGPLAASVADTAKAFLSQADLSKSVRELMLGLHEALGEGRGAAATLCLFRGQTLSCIGVGNVEMRSNTSRVGLICAPGIVGKRMRLGPAIDTELRSGERVVLFSDGLSSRLSLDPFRKESARGAADGLLATFGKTSDDATVLVADVA